MVGRRVVLGWVMRVTRRAHLIALIFESGRVRVVTVGAANALMIHLALNKRSVHIDFIQNLAVGIVGRRLQQFIHVVVIVVLARPVVGIHLVTP